jgi:hypothetical protein
MALPVWIVRESTFPKEFEEKHSFGGQSLVDWAAFEAHFDSAQGRL